MRADFIYDIYSCEVSLSTRNNAKWMCPELFQDEYAFLRIGYQQHIGDKAIDPNRGELNSSRTNDGGFRTTIALEYIRI